MLMRPRFYLNTLVLVMLLFLAAGAGQGAQAAGSEGVSAKLIKPASIVTIRGAVSGLVGQLWTLDQSGTVDDPAKYVLFSTPLTVYDGYRTYKLPTTISVGDITSVRIKVNYKGPANITQAWTWYLYDWVLSKWVKAGDNMGAVAGLWKVLNFTVTVNPTHYVNNVTHQMRLRLVSSNAGGNAKLDYEAISVQYNNACADPLGCVTIRPGDPIHIGYLLALTGNNAALGLEERRGGTIAIDDSAGKILNHAVKFDGKDGACNGAGGLAAARRLAVDASVVAIIGTTCSVEAKAAMPVLSPLGFSMVSPSNTAYYLTQAGGPDQKPGYLRVSWNDRWQGRVAADFARSQLAVARAAVIDDGGWYSSTIVAAFTARFTALGGTITAHHTIDPGGTDFNSILNEIAAGSPDLIYLPVFLPAGGYLIKQAGAIPGLASADLMGADAMMNPDVAVIPGPAADGFLATAGPNPGKFSAQYAGHFVPAYTARYGSAPDPYGFAPYAYDAFRMLKAAIVKSAVPQLPTGTLQIGRQALRNALYGTTGFTGLTGTLKCSPTGDCADIRTAIAVWEYSSSLGKFEKIWP